MFVGCLHSLNYSSVGLSILTSCAKVPGLSPVKGTFFFIPCGIENSYVRKHHMHSKFCKSELVKYIIFQSAQVLPFSETANCKFVHVHLKCFRLKEHTCRVS